MSLSENDIDRISDKVGAKVAEAMLKHTIDEHGPLHARISRLSNKMAYWAGGLAAMFVVVEMAINVWGR